MRKIMVYIIGILIISVSVLSRQLYSIKIENSRLSSNQEALMSNIEFYKTESGKYAAGVKKLELTRDELKKHNNELVNTVTELNVKVKRLQAASTTATHSHYEIKTIVKDSIVYRDTVVKLQRIEFNNSYIDFSGTIDKGEFTGNIHTRDTLVQVIHRIPKKFLFFKFGTRAIRQEVVNKNPYSEITFTEYLEFKK